ncbi:MAG: site-2 protease family protein [Candidatus Omnitrophica bacterium]|nr:site-2 protease family protein [Candidatus Omnitrophota bacterium]
MTVHEFAHGWVAYKRGDTTAKYSGRLTLNPLAHIDIFWTILLPLFLFISTQGSFIFGAAKPVPINYRALKNPKRDIILVGASGPAANFVLAALVGMVIRLIPLNELIFFLAQHLILINIILGVFNLIPIPPLDGSRILFGLLPNDMARGLARIEPYGFFIVIALIWLGLFNRIIWPMVSIIYRILVRA